jgi:hypothetical protein
MNLAVPPTAFCADHCDYDSVWQPFKGVEKITIGSRAKHSFWKLPVKIFVAANPCPDPNVAFKSLRHGAVIARYPHRPESQVGAQSFQSE